MNAWSQIMWYIRRRPVKASREGSVYDGIVSSLFYTGETACEK